MNRFSATPFCDRCGLVRKPCLGLSSLTGPWCRCRAIVFRLPECESRTFDAEGFEKALREFRGADTIILPSEASDDA